MVVVEGRLRRSRSKIIPGERRDLSPVRIRRQFLTVPEAREQIGVPNLHLHDLRHTGNTLAAQSGASLRDLMTRMGHDSPAAALIYQHSSRVADEAIAAALDAGSRSANRG